MAMITNPGWGAASNVAKKYAGGKPLSRRDFLSKDRPKFDNYRQYRNWWERKNPDWKQEYGYYRTGGKPKVTATTISPEPTDDVTPVMNPTNPNADPWDEYTKRLDARETKLMEELIRARNQQAIDLFGAMSGFGAARQQLSAESWDRVLGGYKTGAEGLAGAQGALADDYTAGLQQANEKIAQQFADIGQGGNPNMRDTAAATRQVATAGGSDPAGQLAMVGDNWRSYAATVPGTMSLEQQEAMENARREAIADTDRILTEWREGMLDNEEAAIGLWQTKQKYQWDVEDRATAKTAAKAKAKQDALAFQMQINAYNLKYGAEMADQAKDLSKTTGYVHIYNPKTGKFEVAKDKNGNPVQTQEALEAADRTATTRRGQDMTAAERQADRQARIDIANATNALRSRGLDLDAAKIQKDETKAKGLSEAQRRQYGAKAGTMASNAFNGVDDGTGKMVYLKPEEVVRRLRAQGIPLSIVLDAVAQFAWRAKGPDGKANPWAYARAWRKLPGAK